MAVEIRWQRALLAISLCALASWGPACSSEVGADEGETSADVVAPDSADASDITDATAETDSGSPPRPVYLDEAYPQARARAWGEAQGLPGAVVTRVVTDPIGHVWAAGPWGLAKRAGDSWRAVPIAQGDQPALIDLIATPDRNLYALSATDVYVIDPEEIAHPLAIDIGEGLAIGAGDLEEGGTTGAWLLSSKGVCHASFAPGDLHASCSDWIIPPPGGATGLARDIAGGPEGTVYVAVEDGLYRFVDDAWIPVPLGVPQAALRGLTRGADATIWVASSQGIFRLLKGQPSAVLAFDGAAGLPFMDVARVDLGQGSDPDTVFAIFEGAGVARYGAGRWDLWHSRSWLPSRQVHAATTTADGSLWFGTDAGIGEVYLESMSLEDKARLLEEGTASRHDRLGYFSPTNLKTPGDVASGVTRDDDNDGQWTGMWLAALAFEYAVTKDPTSKARARAASKALRFLEEITPRPGFIARSVMPIADCEPKLTQDPELVGEWHASEDGAWCWKGDTSNDEVLGHIYGQMLYYDLVLDADEDQGERDAVAGMMARMMDDIVDGGGSAHKYQVVDLDGMGTTDGHFDPLFMETIGQYGDAGKNGATILGGLRAAYVMTGEERFQETFLLLANEHGYAENVRREKEIQDAFWINHDSDEMAFMAFLCLMYFEDDPERMAIWREGLTGLWVTQRPERNPEFNFTWALLMGEAAPDFEIDLEPSIRTLKEIPVDLVRWSVQNSGRADIEIDPELDRFGDLQGLEVLPYDERQIMKWNANPYGLDFGSATDDGGRSEEPSTYWILPYWMGRYGGFIETP